MESFTRDDLYRLAAIESPACITIYLPPRLVGSAPQIDMTRLRNLARTARAVLEARLDDTEMIDDLLRPIEVLATAREMWKDSEHGVAIFRSPDLVRVYHIPADIDEGVHVDTRFDLLPLVHFAADDDTFFILSLGRHDVRLYRASLQECAEESLGSMPLNLAEYLQMNEYEPQPQFHSGSHMAVQGRSKRGTIYYDNTSRRQREKDDYIDYLRALERRVMRTVAPTHAPLVLAGVEEARAIFRGASRYAAIAPGGIRSGLPIAQLHAAARVLAKPLLRQRAMLAIDRFLNLAGTGRASADPDEITRRATFGDVETLLIPTGRDTSSDSEGNAISATSRLVTQVLRTDGDVYRIPPGAVDGTMAAVFRY
jgi:hypothetical protein